MFDDYEDEIKTKEFANLTTLSTILLTYMLQLTNTLMWEVQALKDCKTSQVKNISSVISDTIQELFDTCAGLNRHVQKSTFIKRGMLLEKWEEIESLREQTTLLVGGVKRAWEEFGCFGGEADCLVTRSALELLQHHLEGPVNISSRRLNISYDDPFVYVD